MSGDEVLLRHREQDFHLGGLGVGVGPLNRRVVVDDFINGEGRLLVKFPLDGLIELFA